MTSTTQAEFETSAVPIFLTCNFFILFYLWENFSSTWDDWLDNLKVQGVKARFSCIAEQANCKTHKPFSPTFPLETAFLYFMGASNIFFPSKLLTVNQMTHKIFQLCLGVFCPWIKSPISPSFLLSAEKIESKLKFSDLLTRNLLPYQPNRKHLT